MVLDDIRYSEIGAERAGKRTIQPVFQCMSQDYLNMPDSTAAAQAVERVRDSQLPNGAAGSIFVHGGNGRHIGFVRLSALLPILDAHARLAGVLQFDTAMDILEEEASEDVYKKAGIGDLIHQQELVRSETLTSGGIGYPVKVGLTFLMVTLAGGLTVGGLIDFFEGALEALVALAIFIPMVMDMGGNVGTQSTTIFARGLALGHIDLGQFFCKHVGRELLVGSTMGVVLATPGGLIAYFWQGTPNDMPLLGVVVGVALMFSVTTACLLGFLLPWLLLKLGVDHAPGADPFITTIKDFTGLGVYFLTAVWLLDSAV